VVRTVNRVEQCRTLIYPVLIGVGLGILAACAAKPPPPAPKTVAVEPPPPPPPAPRKRRIFPLPTRKPMPPETTASLPEAGAESATAAPPAPALTAAQLIGLDQPATRRLLGPATEQAEAPPASIWRYRTATCELDLFFYLDLRSGKMRTLHYAVKGDQADREDCLRSVVAEHGT